ncbi:hypothetical protein KCU61_g3966, partial [Aureobasidium melanogenum]
MPSHFGSVQSRKKKRRLLVAGTTANPPPSTTSNTLATSVLPSTSASGYSKSTSCSTKTYPGSEQDISMFTSGHLSEPATPPEYQSTRQNQKPRAAGTRAKPEWPSRACHYMKVALKPAKDQRPLRLITLATHVQAFAGLETLATAPTLQKSQPRQETVTELLDDSDDDAPVNQNNASKVRCETCSGSRLG